MPKHGLWFHCASVGEVITLLPLLKDLHQNAPQLKFIVTTNTDTGSRIVKRQDLDYLFHSYLPFDWVSSISRFIGTTQPTALYVMETEIWPNLFTVCHNDEIPVRIINARLSSKTTSANSWIKALLKTALSRVTAVYARTEKDAEAYAQLGAAEDIVTNTGNLKLTTVLSYGQENENQGETEIDTAGREYVLVASTHENEELQIYRIWQQLDRDELLIIAPRHPERSASIIKQLSCRHIAVRSKQQAITAETKVFLLDSIGELNSYFPHAKLVIMGGSFVAVGGHNILEPASANRAIITGPYMENFTEELALMLDSNAIIQLSSYEEIGDCLNRLLNNDADRLSLQENTCDLTKSAEGILENYSAIILKQLNEADITNQ
ncbi:MAG: 3-deoxy-D-manno-octulosonic acid transferase [Proteobacteria bacterium]|nr:3-deoxy-D-manno-octulosonic acid transferase [Pseudomonadota bacterium]